MSDAATPILGVATSRALLGHVTPDGAPHPERPARLDAALEAVADVRDVDLGTPEPADDADLLLVHGQAHLEHIEFLAKRGRWADPDTYVGTESDRLARLGVACCLRCADAACDGTVRRGFACVRPPGHHALPDRPMGFCLYANAALAVRHLQRRRGVTRVAVVDFDVHHGNGTQAAFWRDPDVLTVSLHGHPDHLWPHTGFADERGEGPGEGACLNVPLPPGTTDEPYLHVLREVVVPRVREHRPDVLVVGAGFDAHTDDPLANLDLSTPCFGDIGRVLATLADEACDGRMVVTLEGGYALQALRGSLTAFLRAIAVG